MPSTDSANPPPPDWAAWQRALQEALQQAGATDSVHDALAARLRRQGEAFEAFARTVLQGLESPDGWEQALAAAVQALRGAALGEPATDAARIAELWSLPLSIWQQASGAVAGHGASAPPELGPLRPHLERLLGWPSGDSWKRCQRALAAAGEAWSDYEAAHRAHVELLGAAAAATAESLSQRLASQAEVSDLRALYELWVDASEQAYAELLQSDEYLRAQGRVFDALLRYRRAGRDLLDAWLAELGQPNRTELDATHSKLQQAQRRIERLEEAVEALRRDRPAARRKRRPPPA